MRVEQRCLLQWYGEEVWVRGGPVVWARTYPARGLWPHPPRLMGVSCRESSQPAGEADADTEQDNVGDNVGDVPEWWDHHGAVP